MFIHTNPLNEGVGLEKNEDGRKRELREGKNPRPESSAWHSTETNAHSNYRWQKLRK